MKGELIQFDGSYEFWLEDRHPGKLCLLAAIDDATSAIMDAQFAAHEGVGPVMAFWHGYIGLHGFPQAIYLDRFSTYSMNVKDAKENPDTATVFGRAARELGIRVVHAHSPQAKGRVERLFETLQDRLVKELRLAGIVTPEAANRFLRETFIPDFNRRFAKPAAAQGDLHRKPSPAERERLPFTLCRREGRVLQNDFALVYRNVWYQVLPTPKIAIRPKEDVLVHELRAVLPYPTTPGELAFLHGDLGLSHVTVARMIGATPAAVFQQLSRQHVRRGHRQFGPYGRPMLRRLEFHLRDALPASVNAATPWKTARRLLRRIVRAGYPDMVFRLRLADFIADMPIIAEAERERLAPARLELLRQELKLTVKDIATVLDATATSVREALVRAGIAPGYGGLIWTLSDVHELFATVAAPPPQFYENLSTPSLLRRCRIEFGRLLLVMATAGTLEWTQLDRLVARLRQRRDR